MYFHTFSRDSCKFKVKSDELPQSHVCLWSSKDLTGRPVSIYCARQLLSNFLRLGTQEHLSAVLATLSNVCFSEHFLGKM